MSDITSNLVAYYNMSDIYLGTLHDNAGNSNDATLINSPSSVSGPSIGGMPETDSALGFNGVDQYIQTPIVWSNSGPVTVAFWNYHVTGEADQIVAFGVSSPGGDITDRLLCHAPWFSNTIIWNYGDIGGVGSIQASYASYLDGWHHIALVSEGEFGGYMAIYIDGAVVVEQFVSDGPNGIIDGLAIAAYNDPDVGIRYPNQGLMDEWRIYSRVLTPDDINELVVGLPGTTFLARANTLCF